MMALTHAITAAPLPRGDDPPPTPPPSCGGGPPRPPLLLGGLPVPPDPPGGGAGRPPGPAHGGAARTRRGPEAEVCGFDLGWGDVGRSAFQGGVPLEQALQV